MFKIKSIVPILVSSPYGDGNNLGQPLGFKTLGFVQVTLDNGSVGFGEAYIAIYTPELFKSTVEYISSFIDDAISFSTPSDVYQAFYIPFASRSGLIQSTYSAIDTAIWDAYCKHLNVPFASFLTPSSQHNPLVYYSGGSAKMLPSDIEAEAASIDNTLFSGYKIRIGYHDWSTDLKRIISSTTSKSCDHLMVDSIMGTIRPPFLASDWETKIKDIESLGIYWLEEPLSPDDFHSISIIKSFSNIPLAMGEAITGKFELLSYLKSSALDVLQLDFTHVGGPSLFLDVYPELLACDKMISMHVWGSPLAYNLNTYLGSLLPNCEWTEYPSVRLDINKHLSFSYYNVNSSGLSVTDMIGFSPPSFEDFDFESYPYVPGSSFRWSPK